MLVSDLRKALEGVPDDMPVHVQLGFVVGGVEGAEMGQIDTNDLAETYRDKSWNYDDNDDNPVMVKAFVIHPDGDDYRLSRDET